MFNLSQFVMAQRSVPDLTLAAARHKSTGLLDFDSINKACCWQAACYIANSLQFKTCQFNRRTRERFYVATGVLSLAIWLFLAAAEIHPPLHAWLHGGTIPDDDDDCAIVAIAHGNVDSVACDVPAVVPVTWIEVVPRIEFSVFHKAMAFLPDGRAPPFPCFAS